MPRCQTPQGTSSRRAKLGEMLGLGFANAKTFLKRLNHYGVTQAEFAAALAKLDGRQVDE